MLRPKLRLAELAKGLWKTWIEDDLLRQHEGGVLLVLTLIIGAMVGLVVVAFIVVTEHLGASFYPEGSAAWLRLVVPVIGALVTGVLIKRYFPEARGSGVPQTEAALLVNDGFIDFNTVVGKFGCSSVSLASGIALGREGPAVQMGAGIASVLGRCLGLPPARIKSLVPAGAAAALAAAFNTPIAAVLFILEEVMGDLHAPILGSIVLSSATSWIVLHLFLGDEPLFHVPPYQLIHPLEFGLYAVLGVLGGLVSVCFVKLLLWLRANFFRMPAWTTWLQPVAGGLTVAVMAWMVPNVLGVGYGVVGLALNGKLAVGAMALLVVLKLVASASCYSSGNAGGIFGPSLFIGAMLGGAVGGFAHQLVPDYTGGVGAYALVGMGVAFAGIVRQPMTSVIMIFEITRDYSIIVPLMISNLLSYFISHRLQRESIYGALLRQDGIHLPPGGGYRAAIMMTSQAMSPARRVLSAGDVVQETDIAGAADEETWAVFRGDSLAGVLTTAQLREAVGSGLGERRVGEILPALEPDTPSSEPAFPHVHKDHPVDMALQRMAGAKLTELPVVSRANVGKLEGMLSLKDVLNAYGLGDGDARREEPPVRQSRPVGPLLVGILTVVVATLGLSGLLTYRYRVNLRAKGAEYYLQGNELAAAGRLEEAILKYRNALSISHDNKHRLALAEKLLQAQRPNEAIIYFSELLRTEPNSGPANVGYARIMAEQGNIEEATTYYQRAIYGNWPEDPRGNQVRTRMEYVALLRNHGGERQALSELVKLDELVKDDVTIRKRIAQTMTELGAQREAREIYRDIVNRDGRDTEALVALGEAELALERFQNAGDVFRRAQKLRPDDDAIRGRLLVAEEILMLDPTPRGLGARERYRRSQALVELTRNALVGCASFDDQTPVPDALQQLLKTAGEAASTRRQPRSYDDATEENIATAGELWSYRGTMCGPPGDSFEPLSRVMTLVTR